MFRKLVIASLVAVTAVIITGCSSVETGTYINNQRLTPGQDERSIGHVYADIWGIYLFSLPLFTGSSTNPGSCAIFKDTVTVDKCTTMITKKSAQMGGSKLLDLKSNKSGMWLILVSYYDIEMSGNCIK